jgi:hypothetical protein
MDPQQTGSVDTLELAELAFWSLVLDYPEAVSAEGDFVGCLDSWTLVCSFGVLLC